MDLYCFFQNQFSWLQRTNLTALLNTEEPSARCSFTTHLLRIDLDPWYPILFPMILSYLQSLMKPPIWLNMALINRVLGSSWNLALIHENHVIQLIPQIARLLYLFYIE
uniref:Uncharacterized protein n=1 Tax=Arthrobotrys musiformis TaxID=47236 RepID=A0A482EAB8_9PEZI|nr:hypothetical protein [Arthrobotrys musiformis]